MLPLSDENPTMRTPYLTWLLIAANVLVFIWTASMNIQELQRTFFEYSVVPAQITQDPFSTESILDVLRSMFFHAGIAHILFNMLYMYLFADNVEDRLGKLAFVFIYFASGVGAVVAQVVINPASQVPMVGASGAIAGILGSYLVMYPGVEVRGIVPIGGFGFFTSLPAWVVLGFWFVTQLFSGVASLGAQTQYSGGTAFFAHAGGFAFGAVMTLILLVIIPSPKRSRRERYQTLYDRLS